MVADSGGEPTKGQEIPVDQINSKLSLCYLPALRIQHGACRPDYFEFLRTERGACD